MQEEGRPGDVGRLADCLDAQSRNGRVPRQLPRGLKDGPPCPLLLCALPSLHQGTGNHSASFFKGF